MTAHQFASRKLGAGGFRDIDFGCEKVSDVYGPAAAGTHFAPAGMGMHNSKKATVRA
jgi:hypothetical protein